MVLLRNFINILYVPELRKKVLFTLGILIVYRFGVHIPVIGIDIEALRHIMERFSGFGGFLSYLDRFSGGDLSNCTLFALGMGPYITASIIMQMLGMTVPYLEQLLKEGDYGRKLVNQYTRYLTFAVSIVQSLGLAFMLERYQLVLDPSWGFRLMFIFSLTIGSMFVMWLGEQISLFGIGNGSSMIIFAGIVSRFPADIAKTIYYVQQGMMDSLVAILILLFFIAIAACIVFLERGDRKVPVQYTRRVVGQRVYGGQSSYIPFKINMAGVMPVIFAGAILNIPIFIASLLSARFPVFQWVSDSLVPTGIIYNVLEFIFIICFSYLYTALVYNPQELADNIKKSGGYIPGIRPGKQTAEFFNYILTRVGLMGAIYLAALALLPNILAMFVTLPFYLGGTSLLIVVGVALDTASQIEAYLIEHRYEGFLVDGRMAGRGSR